MANEEQLAKVRKLALDTISRNRIAGQNTRHDRANNIKAVEQLVTGHTHYTFGIKGVEDASTSNALDAIASITHCSRDFAYRQGGGYISPQATLYGLEMGIKSIVQSAQKRQRILVGTGHPGSLLAFYIELVKLIRQWGGQIVEAARGVPVPPNFDLDYIEGVAILSDRASVWHTHDPRAMQEILKADSGIDLAVVDHGFAGGAINAGIPTVTIIDTNDPAPAVAKEKGANVIIIPMDDNRPPYAYMPLIEVVKDLAALTGVVTPTKETTPREEVVHELTEAEELICERAGGQAGIEELIDDFAETFREQFVQTRLHGDEEEEGVSVPYAALATYGILRKSLDDFIIKEIHYRQPNLRPEEVAWYFRHYTAMDVCGDGAVPHDRQRKDSPKPRRSQRHRGS